MEEKPLTGQESLEVIQQMIYQAKREQKDDGKGWIIWGWLLFAASVFTYINLYTKWVATFFFWSVFGVITLSAGLVEIVKYFFYRKSKPVRTYTKDLFNKLNIGFFLFLAFIILSINLGLWPVRGFAFLIGLYAFWILIYGTILNFRPSVIAGFVTWGFGFAALFVKDFAWIMLLHAGAVLCGYIIPGHIAYREFKKIR